MLRITLSQTGISLAGTLLLLGLSSTALASGPSAATTISVDPPAASLALERYFAGPENTPWSEPNAVVLEIDASLPGLEERGHLRAIRHWHQRHRPDYEVVRIEGDATVKQQVIARYLTAEQEAATMPAASAAITLANYRFRYLGLKGGTSVYVFQITPRHKRPGLIKGELWIDGTMGIAVHEAGCLVKRPSIFIRRFKITRDVSLRDVTPYLRTTHLDIDARFAGRVELTVIESPCVAPLSTVVATQESNSGKAQDDECTYSDH